MPIGAMACAEWLNMIKDSESGLQERLVEIYGDDALILEDRKMIFLRALEGFATQFGGDREVVISRAPGRINLLGNHIDHRGGFVNYMAINRDTLMVASARQDDTVEMRNTNLGRFPPRSFEIGNLLPPEMRGNWLKYIEGLDLLPGDWSNYVQAAVLHLQDRFPNQHLNGMDLVVTGDVPIAAGLSSSSTLVVTSLQAALHFSGLTLPREELAEFCGDAEWYVGTRGGAGDHAAMLYAKRQAVLPLRFFPLETSEVLLPEGYRVVACNSFVEHAPPGIFNERIATYEIGFLLIKSRFPRYAPKLERLRDLSSDHLGIPLTEIYNMIKQLPGRMSRSEILTALPDHVEFLQTLFSPHGEPRDGYRIRQVMVFGLAECARGAQCKDLLESGDMDGFGRLKYCSHDGDRRFDFTSGDQGKSVDNAVGDGVLDQLILDLESGESEKVNRAQIHHQPGGYDCSCEELDLLVDLSATVDGVVGAGLAGGGLGGCVLVVVKESAVNTLIQKLNDAFYTPRNLSNGTLVCASVAGSGLI